MQKPVRIPLKLTKELKDKFEAFEAERKEYSKKLEEVETRQNKNK